MTNHYGKDTKHMWLSLLITDPILYLLLKISLFIDELERFDQQAKAMRREDRAGCA